MSVVQRLELVGTLEQCREAAVQQLVRERTQSLRHITG